MGKRHAADRDNHQYETPQKRQKVAFETPTSCSPALNVSFQLTREFVDGTILTDLTLKDWRIGKPIGKGSFGEIFLASDDVSKPVTSENAKYVVKIEPHSNGPLFVEIHALLNTAKRSESNPIPPGMPEYIASGSHYFKDDERYRFLILKRYQRDLHSLIRNRRVDPKSIPIIACQILDVLEHLHDKGYVHSDIKAENLMIAKVPVSELASLKSTRLLISSENSPNKKKTASNDGLHSYNGLLSTPTVTVKKAVEFSGSNPVRSCRGNGVAESEVYQNMVKSHYLRPLKNIVYRDDSDDEDLKNSKKKHKRKKDADKSKSFFYHITTKNVGENFKQIDVQVSQNCSAFKVEGKAAASAEDEDKKKRKQAGPGPMEERIHLIDFGLASKFMDSTGQHRPFCMDQRRAHDGTLEFTSRDAHMGAHARRSDLECLGYNLIFWSRGFLPWKDEKTLNQPEQVHRMKEYFMTDVREMLKTIYGEDCPKYLGEFLHYVGGLTYDERPDYDYLRSLFFQELQRLGHKPKSRLKLVVEDIAKLSTRLTSQDEAESTNKINHVKSLMKLGVLPYRESTLHNKTTSPKNLRSKRDSTRTPANGKTKSGSPAKKEKKFCWSDILSTDPDQIARERAEKEFERADQMEEVVIRYSGNPTYAIREIENKSSNALDYIESEDYIKGYTKPMMDILRKRQSQLMRDITEANGFSSNGVKKPPDVKQREKTVVRDAEPDEDEEMEQEEDEVEEDGSDNEEEAEDEEDEEVPAENEEEDSEAEEEGEDEEADSGNDDVDGEEEEEVEEEQIHDRRKITQGKKQVVRKLGRTTKPTAIRKEESDSDFINDVEEEEEDEEPQADVEEDAEKQELEDDEEGAPSEASEVIGKPRKVRRRQLLSESSDQKDSDFNDQESSEYESRDSRSQRKQRGRTRLNRDRSKPGHNNHQPYSKANAGNNKKVPVIARNNNNNDHHHHYKPYYGDVDDSSHDAPLQQNHARQQQQQKFRLMKRRKSGLRERIRPTARSINYQDDLQQKKSRKTSHKRYSDDEDYCQVDESSCSSACSVKSGASTTTSASSDNSEYPDHAAPKRKSSRKRVIRTFSNSSRSALSSHSRASSVHNVAANGGVSTTATTNGNGIYSNRRIYPDDEDDFFDDDDTRDMDYSPVKSTKRTQRKPISSRKAIASLKKRNGESRGAGGSSSATSGNNTGSAASGTVNGDAVAKGGVVAGLRGRRDHTIRTYSRG